MDPGRVILGRSARNVMARFDVDRPAAVERRPVDSRIARVFDVGVACDLDAGRDAEPCESDSRRMA